MTGRFSKVLTGKINVGLITAWILTLGLVGLGGPGLAAAVSPTATCGGVSDPAQDRSASIYSEQTGVTAINQARAAEGLGALSLPGNFYSLSPTDRILILFNQERQSRGLSTFSQNDPALSQTATNHSQVLVDFNLFAHDDAVDGTFSNRVSNTPGLKSHYSSLGEIIAGAPFSTYMVWLWLYADSSSSWGHRHNIFGCFTNVGIGYVSGGAYGANSTSDFLNSNGSYQPVGPDTGLPSLGNAQITFNSLVSSNLSVSVPASDSGSGMRHVAFFLDANGNFGGTSVPSYTVSNGVYSKTFSGVAAGNHTLTIVAVDNNNNFVRSDLTIQDMASAPATPTNLTAQAASSSQINLSWSAVGGSPTGLELQRSTDTTNWTSIPISNPAATSYQDTGLASATTYVYQLRASNSKGTSGFSNQARATTSAVLPAQPTNLTVQTDATYGFNTLNLSWTRQAAQPGGYNETGFEIQRNIGGGWVTIATVGAGTITFKDSGLAASTSYSYQVRAINSAGASAYSTSTNGMTSALPTVDVVVDDPLDDGTQTASNGHTYNLSYALAHTATGHAISFNVAGGVIQVSGPFALPASSGIFVNPGGSCASPITLQYSGLTTNLMNGLPVGNKIYVQALTIKGFTGWQIQAAAPGSNHLVCVKASKS